MDSDDGLDRALSSLPDHRRLLERALEWLCDDDRIAGVVLGGSFADPTVDTDSGSDLDLYVVVRDGAFESIFADRDAIAAAIGDPLFGFVPDHLPGGDRDYVVLYDGPVKVDFVYVPWSDFDPAWKWSSVRPLYDATGRIADVVAASRDRSPPQPTSEALRAHNEGFWIQCWYVHTKIERGERWAALDGLHTIRTQVLCPLLAWSTGTPEEGYRRLERRLESASDSTLPDRFAATVATPDRASLSSAMDATIDCYLELRDAVADRYDFSFDPDPERAVIEAIESREHPR